MITALYVFFLCFCLRSGVTSVPEAQDLLDGINHLLGRVLVVPIVSADNPADCHSRNCFRDLDARMIRLDRVIKELMRGRRVGQPDTYVRYPDGSTRLRHEPSEEDHLEAVFDVMIEDEEIDL